MCINGVLWREDSELQRERVGGDRRLVFLGWSANASRARVGVTGPNADISLFVGVIRISIRDILRLNASLNELHLE